MILEGQVAIVTGSQLEVNLSGTFYCTQAAARKMAERRYGRVVNLSSVAGLIGPIDLAAYGAAKAGIVGLTRGITLSVDGGAVAAGAYMVEKYRRRKAEA